MALGKSSACLIGGAEKYDLFHAFVMEKITNWFTSLNVDVDINQHLNASCTSPSFTLPFKVYNSYYNVVTSSTVVYGNTNSIHFTVMTSLSDYCRISATSRSSPQKGQATPN